MSGNAITGVSTAVGQIFTDYTDVISDNMANIGLVVGMAVAFGVVAMILRRVMSFGKRR